MINHLPECWCANGPCPQYPGATCPCRECICDWLRACEQRVLNAAQEAVAAVREPYLHPQYDEAISDALAAIEALRGEQ